MKFDGYVTLGSAAKASGVSYNTMWGAARAGRLRVDVVADMYVTKMEWVDECFRRGKVGTRKRFEKRRSLSACVEQSFHDKIVAVARVNKIRISDVVRDALQHYLGEDSGKNND